MYEFCFYFFMVFFFSVIGWLTECIACTIGKGRFTIDRGFLLGPYCPIYGFGTLFFYLFLKNVSVNDPVLIFVLSMISASVLEYVTSYVMEKLFRARWWDYSQKKFNLNGRICLKNSIGFGLIGIAFTYYIKPVYIPFAESIPKNTLITISLICLVIFVTDYIFTYTIMGKIKHKLSNIKKDSTTEIDKQVREILSQHLFSVRRLFKSFPNIKFSLPGGDIIIKSLNKALASLDDIRKERKERIKKIKKILTKEKEKK